MDLVPLLQLFMAASAVIPSVGKFSPVSGLMDDAVKRTISNCPLSSSYDD